MMKLLPLLLLLLAMPIQADQVKPEAWTAVLFVRFANSRDVMAFPDESSHAELAACDEAARMGLSLLFTRMPPAALSFAYAACFEGEHTEFEGATAITPQLPTIEKQPPPIEIQPEQLENTG